MTPISRRDLKSVELEPLHVARNGTKADVFRFACAASATGYAVLKDMRARAAWYRLGVGRYFLWREWRALKALDGVEGIPRVLARPDADCLVMEWRAGTPIAARRQGEVAAQSLERVAQIIEVAHARGVVHGDLHRSNVLLDESGQVTLIDWATAGVFGVGRALWKRWTWQEWRALDARAVAKLKAHYTPQDVRPDERDLLINGGSPLYRLVRRLGHWKMVLRGGKVRSPQRAVEEYRRKLDG